MGSGQTMPEITRARKAVAIRGSSISLLSVISMTMTKAVIGVCTTPEK